MLIYIIKGNKIETFNLPVNPNGNYWIFDKDMYGDKRSLVHVTAENSEWKISSNSDVKIVANQQYISEAILRENNFYNLSLNNGREIVTLYCSASYDKTYRPYNIIQDGAITIGRNSTNTIVFNMPYIKESHAILSYKNGKFNITTQDNGGIFVNKLFVKNANLKPGDIIFLMGLKIIIMGSFIIINNPNNLVRVNETILKPKQRMNLDEINVAEEDNNDDFEEIDYFFRAPRFKTKLERLEVAIDAPPTKAEPSNQPFILIFGPMATMMLVSLVSLTSAISALMSGQRNFLSTLPTLVSAFSMLCGSMLWPTLNRNWQKKEAIRKEKLRQEKYTDYINKKAEDIRNIMTYQKNALEENYPSMEECQNIIINKKRNLWERKIDSEDFLCVRLGIGEQKTNIDIKFPEEKFSLFEDNLLNEAREIVTKLNTIKNVPITISLAEKYITAVVGVNKEATTNFINSLILQTVTLQSCEDVKIVVLTTEENEYKWDYIKSLPHCWDDTKTNRYFASNNEEIKQISNLLEIEFNKRISDEQKNTKDEKKYISNPPYYIILTDNLTIVRNTEIIKKILKNEENIGFSLIIQNDRLTNLPNECFEFISIDAECTVFENELSGDSHQKFTPNNTNNIDIIKCCEKLSNIPIKLEKTIAPLPKTLSFLEMFQVGNISQLNILNTWRKNNPSLSLSVPVGVDETGELFKLDLHEKFHGPHGLVAGMTGSGKSEFIITYILSLAINFHPNEVAFVIIDYKGGGLAGAFQNKETGVKLPHLIGTLTNLETNEMNRAIASIDSELKRRQRLFNETRDKLNESTIDIYKYQRLYREGKIDIPLPHLFIISDEFAELKSQQPEFLDNLISIARIGRSLGVHLILCTQKPAGVVNDQIWSNSKFRVCLKVQDKSDSMDMIKREDAASLKEAGRFYLQVGYNELFKLGQAAWCGAPYYETDKIKKNIDTSISFIDNTGYIFKSIDNDKKGEVVAAKGDELTNIVSYLDNLAKEQQITTTPLWLESMPEYMNIENLKKKYNFQKQDFKINIPIGEYDIPSKQTQKLLSVSLEEEGNIAIFGSSSTEREHVLSTLIYSAMTNYRVDEINFYIIDLGAETLKIFSPAPHVDNVILLDEKDKIKTVIKMINEILTKRKKTYSEYNGNYYEYCTKSGKSDPTIILAINNYDTFMETFPEYEEQFTQMSRDCSRYGINLLFTLSTTTNLRYRIRQNIKNIIMLQMNEPGDYAYILQNAKRMQPSKKYGRGLTDINDEVFELQIASIAKTKEEEKDVIMKTCKALTEMTDKKATEVPVLPDIVTYELLAKNALSISKVPIGINTETLKETNLNLNNNQIIVANDMKSFKHFIKPFTELLIRVPNTSVILADTPKTFKDYNINEKIYNNKNFDRIIDSISNYIDKLYKVYEKNDNDVDSLNQYTNIVLIINNLKQFNDHISTDNQKIFKDLIDKATEIKKLTIILIDTLNNFKSLDYEDIYRKINTSNNTGIWIGNGVYDQLLLRLTKTPAYLKQEIKDNFGYYIQNGNPVQIKVLCDQDLDKIQEEE